MLKKAMLLFGAALALGAAAVSTHGEREKIHLVAAIPFTGASKKDVAMVEERVNAITREKIGVSVEFAALDSYNDQINLMLSGEEQLDVMAVMNDRFIECYVNRQLLPLDSYLEKYGQGICGQVGENVIHCCDINNTLYGIPNNRDYASESNSYMLRKDILDKYGISPDSIKTMEDLERVFEIVKKGEPDMTVLLPGYGTILGNQYYLVGNFRPGVHMDYGREEEICSVFESDEYKAALKRVRKWYLKGYLEKNALGTTESVLKRVEKGEVFAYTTKGKPNIISQDDRVEGPEMVCVPLDEASITYNSIPGISYVITKNTVSPEYSMKFLNLLYTDAEIMNLLCYGVEGVHYRKMEDGHLTFTEDGRDNPFLNIAWSKPNQYITDVWEGNPFDVWEQLRAFNENAIQGCSVGFNFDIGPVETEYTRIKEIYEQYSVLLENGLINPEEGLEKMLREMKACGLENVLTVERQQFERWKKRKIIVFPS